MGRGGDPVVTARSLGERRAASRRERRKRVHEAYAASRLGTWFALKVAPPIDRVLLSLTRGRASSYAGMPVGLLTVRGARSGLDRRVPLVYLTDGDRIVLTGSNGGSASHPSWFHNCVANPAVEYTAAGRTRRYVARVAGPEERAELWPRMTELYAGYGVYQARAGQRTIPLVILEPAR
jgi:deazaflavin-dependent oxidoreductase (nitroreductase family)